MSLYTIALFLHVVAPLVPSSLSVSGCSASLPEKDDLDEAMVE